MEGDEANKGRQCRLNITTIYTLAFTGKTQVADEDENFTRCTLMGILKHPRMDPFLELHMHLREGMHPRISLLPRQWDYII